MVKEREVEHITELEFQGLHFAYEQDQPLLEDVTLKLPTNKIVAVTGPLGSGKSAFLKILCGLETPTQGSYQLNNHSVEKMSFEDLLPYRLKMGFSFDYGGLINNKTLKDNVELPLLYHKLGSREEVDQRAEKLIHEFGLEAVANVRPASVSGGMRKAACVARSFAMIPEFLILDDPTTGLNKNIRKKLKLKVKKEFESGRTPHIYICTQDDRFLSGLATHQLRVADKNIVFGPYGESTKQAGAA